jgi:hypothetical protein
MQLDSTATASAKHAQIKTNLNISPYLLWHDRGFWKEERRLFDVCIQQLA